jgi:uncharacterized protein (DUF58 family)
MLRIIILAALAYVGFRYYGWIGAVGVLGVYVLLLVVLGAINANTTRQAARQLVDRKLSAAEKTHLTATQEHQHKMHEHKAQFDPELRKSRGQ